MRPWLLLALPILSSGCVVGPGGKPDAGSGTAAAFVQEYCSLAVGCCRPSTSDPQYCHAAVEGSMRNRSFDPTAAEACLTWLRAAAKSAGFCEKMGPFQGPDCRTVIEGATLKLGAPCEWGRDRDCLGSAEGSVACEKGKVSDVCTVEIVGSQGDTPCIGSIDGRGFGSALNSDPPYSRAYICRGADGLRCDLKTQTCVAFVGPGAPCPGDEECDPWTAYCDWLGSGNWARGR
jgi:hypothetical protein